MNQSLHGATQRVHVARRALATLEAVLEEDLGDAICRDAALLRFDYTFEAAMRSVQAFLLEHEGLRALSPKAMTRASFRAGLLSEGECVRAIRMADDGG